jgi:NADPH-dependent 2,4-dienoyl-CoA reductase/sulfur reductase-like enzyme
MKRVVIAGSSIAGLSAARHLRGLGFDGTIQLVDADPVVPYRRPEMSKSVLTGKATIESTTLRWPDRLGLERLQGVRLLDLDLARRRLRAEADGSALELPFDGLVVATGCAARRLPLEPALAGVMTLRSAADADVLRRALATASDLVVIGGGFIGLEVAAAARAMRRSVTVIEVAQTPVAEALGTVFGASVARLHDAHGVRLLTSSRVVAIEGSATVERVRLHDGSLLPADLVLIAVGAVPEVGWLQRSGLPLENGVVCDPTCAVGPDAMVAAGDVARWRNPLYGAVMRVEHWANALEQGNYAARRLMGRHDPAGFSSAPYFWSDQFGVSIQCLGYPGDHDSVRTLASGSTGLVLGYGRRGRLVAVAAQGTGIDLSGFRSQLLQPTPLENVARADDMLVGQPSPS